MFIVFIIMVLIYWDYNILEKNDLKWVMNVYEVLKGNEYVVVYNGKYNFG